MEFDAGAVQALRRGGGGPKFIDIMYHQHVIYSCDLVNTQQRMACPATIAKIYQRDGAWVQQAAQRSASCDRRHQMRAPSQILGAPNTQANWRSG